MYVKVKGHEVIEPWFNSKYAIELRAQTLGSQIVINNPLHQQLFCSVLKYPLKLDLHCKIADCLHKLGAHKYCLKQQALSPKQQWLMVVLILNQFTLVTIKRLEMYAYVKEQFNHVTSRYRFDLGFMCRRYCRYGTRIASQAFLLFAKMNEISI